VEVVAEVHDHIEPGTSEKLREAFTPSHEIEEIHARERRIADFPELGLMPWVTRLLAIHEFRAGEGRWFELRPRRHSGRLRQQ
jgi:hypothetical protein